MLTRMRMMRRLPLLSLALLAMLAVGACSSTTNKTAGENIDDAAITAQVKTKLAAEKIGELGEDTVLDLAGLEPIHEQPRRVAGLDGRLRDQLRRKVVVQVGRVHRT